MIQKKAKVYINSTESREEYIVEATINNNIIEYREKDNTKVELNIKENILKRENEKMIMNFSFNLLSSTSNTITLKDLNHTLEVVIKTIRINNEVNKYLVEYEIVDNDKITYIVEIGE